MIWIYEPAACACRAALEAIVDDFPSPRPYRHVQRITFCEQPRDDRFDQGLAIQYVNCLG